MGVLPRSKTKFFKKRINNLLVSSSKIAILMIEKFTFLEDLELGQLFLTQAL